MPSLVRFRELEPWAWGGQSLTSGSARSKHAARRSAPAAALAARKADRLRADGRRLRRARACLGTQQSTFTIQPAYRDEVEQIGAQALAARRPSSDEAAAISGSRSRGSIPSP